MDNPVPDHSPVLRQFPYGLYLLGSSRNGHALVILANWVTQLSFSPPLIGIAIEIGSRMHQYISDSGFFSVNVLPEGGADLAKDFLKSQDPKDKRINGHPFSLARHGSPIIEDASSCLECRIVDSIETGDHTLFIGQVIQSQVNSVSPGMTLKESGLSYFKKSQ